MSGDSSTIEEATRGRVHVKNIIPNDLGPGKKAFTFQRPSSRTGSRATSIKAEPGSALESNLESNASVSASVRAEKQEASPSSRFMASVGLQEQVLLSTDSSMCSLLKSSDDFSSTTPNDGSEDDEKEFAPHRPSLPDPSWLTNVDMSPQIIMNYQMKSKPLTEVLKRDQNALQLMTQPNQVREQLAQLYRELEDTGEIIRPLLEADATTSCSTTSSSSNGDESDEIAWKNQRKKQVKFERYGIIYGEDAPMPPSLKNLEIREKENLKSSEMSTTSSGEGTGKNDFSKNSVDEDFKDSNSLSNGSSSCSSKSGSKGNGGSTSLGSSSAITVEAYFRSNTSGESPDDDANKDCASGTCISKGDEGIGSKSSSSINVGNSGKEDESAKPMELNSPDNDVKRKENVNK